MRRFDLRTTLKRASIKIKGFCTLYKVYNDRLVSHNTYCMRFNEVVKANSKFARYGHTPDKRVSMQTKKL